MSYEREGREPRQRRPMAPPMGEMGDLGGDPLGAAPPPPMAPPPQPVLGGIARPQVQRPNGTSPNGAGVPNQTMPVGDPAPLGDLPPPPAVSAPGARQGGGLARYGTDDIEEAKGLAMGDYGGQLEGFSGVSRRAAGERGGNTIKNSFGDIASRYDVTQPGAAQKVFNDPDFRMLHPDAQFVEGGKGDLIDFDGPGPDMPVDVIRGANADGSGQGWQWGPQDQGFGAGGGGMDGLYGGMNLAGLLGGADPMNDIMANVQGLAEGNMPDAERSALMKLLMESGGGQV